MTDALKKLNWTGYSIPEPALEYRFNPERRWRFDYAWPKVQVAVEVEGGIWTRGRHTRGAGFLADMEKYNFAAKVGWRVFRFTPDQLANGEAQLFVRDLLR